ncbi:50S ribosomal protein L6 [Candidatus Falkowbacteria bacterium RIFOXYB2_FULL_34_18]|uniref:Large ribosomal subunit protein uL6 n=1 Tax=Candidatus Falkowbacteria bacterium RIFOXYD2_FULL_34_120 TaxID=1798007 RepID=A0A1F5TTG8_9BACT|nr:MAG: 50S ribosomal protein L6 [Candidatus Falkowbacteria bacterium RIFOXYB2_FULL_34_18]OGF30056.1 MAG: 50S ribosomal protein L6 [Candidatus Falkowbacteria bacterium RIFOXYC12_FULL_34_55]OGF37611.1 MAG: 50S ribosomal protein L6 [Candidatus Falkowbacteria bacterium RIFOXYC2_FULL_34_220]OGF39366.1 MAG: 50S ribosomal protein L6 [Candidatus Falkowbacteria bacterium RIFOXYD12_FULL_34_57]OGF41871.1 MAG: 50S ribosomal protein L6 [Candidatus Falkowbacteria bacterium RIFOXYD2_FULL_34_120]
MSRLGKIPIKLIDGVQAKIENNFIIIKGPKGELKQELNKLVKVEIKDKEIVVSVKNGEIKKEKAFWGLYRSLINNMVAGVTQGYEKRLEIVGVGYRVALNGKKLTFSVGYSHPVDFEMPEGITAQIEGNNKVVLTGFDKQLIGETAAQIRKIRKPEPYKGKGIRYADETIIKKEGKSATKGA